MSTSSENQRRYDSMSLQRVASRHPIATFLFLAFAFGWAVQLALFQVGLPSRSLSSLSVLFGLALPAFLVTAAVGGRAGVRDLLGRCLRWRVGVHWYLIAMLGLLSISLLSAIPFLGTAPLEALAEKWPLVFTLFLPELLIAFVLIQISEEAAWTGFMQHNLQERRGPLLASIMVAPAFALWHLVGNFWGADRIAQVLGLLAVQAVLAIFFRVVIMSLYNRSGQSVLIVALFHTAFNSATGSGGMRFTGELFSGLEAQLIPLAVLTGVAVVLVAFTRGRLGYRAGPASSAPTRT